MRKGFTLIELMISVVILSILMLFLYKSYSGLNKSNKIFAEEVQKVSKIERLKKVIYLDYGLAIKTDTNSSAIKIINQEKNEDVVFMQTSNSIHNRVNPYVAYILKEDKLYRLESLKEFTNYPLESNLEFDNDYLGEFKIFRAYESKNGKTGTYLVHLKSKKDKEILLKLKILND